MYMVMTSTKAMTTVAAARPRLDMEFATPSWGFVDGSGVVLGTGVAATGGERHRIVRSVKQDRPPRGVPR